MNKEYEMNIDEKILVNRAQIEHRATWMALIYLEVEKAGIDPEPIFRAAIRQTGHIHGERIRNSCQDPTDLGEVTEVFLTDTGRKTFDMDNINFNNEEFCANFHYCALLEAWRKLGLSDELCEKLCDIAMDGDRGIAESLGLNLDLTETLAQNKPTCSLRFFK